MKKLITSSIICMMILSIATFSMARIVETNEGNENANIIENNIGEEVETTTGEAVSNLIQEVDQDSKTSELVDLKENEKKSLDYYNEKYGSEAYGFTAYLLDKIRIYSIPLCFLGIAISAIYQYVLGIRKLDVRDKGFGVMIAIITVFVICQVLPLVFAIVVRGWRG